MRYQITYEFKGVEVIDVWLPKGTELPKNWDDLGIKEQDEWLYEHQELSESRYKDVHHGEAVAVLPVTEGLRVIA